MPDSSILRKLTKLTYKNSNYYYLDIDKIISEKLATFNTKDCQHYTLT